MKGTKLRQKLDQKVRRDSSPLRLKPVSGGELENIFGGRLCWGYYYTFPWGTEIFVTEGCTSGDLPPIEVTKE